MLLTKCLWISLIGIGIMASLGQATLPPSEVMEKCLMHLVDKGCVTSANLTLVQRYNCAKANPEENCQVVMNATSPCIDALTTWNFAKMASEECTTLLEYFRFDPTNISQEVAKRVIDENPDAIAELLDKYDNVAEDLARKYANACLNEVFMVRCVNETMADPMSLGMCVQKAFFENTSKECVLFGEAAKETMAAVQEMMATCGTSRPDIGCYYDHILSKNQSLAMKLLTSLAPSAIESASTGLSSMTEKSFGIIGIDGFWKTTCLMDSIASCDPHGSGLSTDPVNFLDCTMKKVMASCNISMDSDSVVHSVIISAQMYFTELQNMQAAVKGLMQPYGPLGSAMTIMYPMIQQAVAAVDKELAQTAMMLGLPANDTCLMDIAAEVQKCSSIKDPKMLLDCVMAKPYIPASCTAHTALNSTWSVMEKNYEMLFQGMEQVTSVLEGGASITDLITASMGAQGNSMMQILAPLALQAVAAVDKELAQTAMMLGLPANNTCLMDIAAEVQKCSSIKDPKMLLDCAMAKPYIPASCTAHTALNSTWSMMEKNYEMLFQGMEQVTSVMEGGASIADMVTALTGAPGNSTMQILAPLALQAVAAVDKELAQTAMMLGLPANDTCVMDILAQYCSMMDPMMLVQCVVSKATSLPASCTAHTELNTTWSMIESIQMQIKGGAEMAFMMLNGSALNSTANNASLAVVEMLTPAALQALATFNEGVDMMAMQFGLPANDTCVMDILAHNCSDMTNPTMLVGCLMTKATTLPESCAAHMNATWSMIESYQMQLNGVGARLSQLVSGKGWDEAATSIMQNLAPLALQHLGPLALQAAAAVDKELTQMAMMLGLNDTCLRDIEARNCSNMTDPNMLVGCLMHAFTTLPESCFQGYMDLSHQMQLEGIAQANNATNGTYDAIIQILAPVLPQYADMAKELHLPTNDTCLMDIARKAIKAPLLKTFIDIPLPASCTAHTALTPYWDMFGDYRMHVKESMLPMLDPYKSSNATMSTMLSILGVKLIGGQAADEMLNPFNVSIFDEACFADLINLNCSLGSNMTPSHSVSHIMECITSKATMVPPSCTPMVAFKPAWDMIQNYQGALAGFAKNFTKSMEQPPMSIIVDALNAAVAGGPKEIVDVLNSVLKQVLPVPPTPEADLEKCYADITTKPEAYFNPQCEDVATCLAPFFDGPCKPYTDLAMACAMSVQSAIAPCMANGTINCALKLVGDKAYRNEILVNISGGGCPIAAPALTWTMDALSFLDYETIRAGLFDTMEPKNASKPQKPSPLPSSHTPTPITTNTHTPTPTPTPTPSPTSINTPTPSPVPTSINTYTPTPSPIITATPTRTPTGSQTPTPRPPPLSPEVFANYIADTFGLNASVDIGAQVNNTESRAALANKINYTQVVHSVGSTLAIVDTTQTSTVQLEHHTATGEKSKLIINDFGGSQNAIVKTANFEDSGVNPLKVGSPASPIVSFERFQDNGDQRNKAPISFDVESTPPGEGEELRVYYYTSTGVEPTDLQDMSTLNTVVVKSNAGSAPVVRVVAAQTSKFMVYSAPARSQPETTNPDGGEIVVDDSDDSTLTTILLAIFLPVGVLMILLFGSLLFIVHRRTKASMKQSFDQEPSTFTTITMPPHAKLGGDSPESPTEYQVSGPRPTLHQQPRSSVN